MKHLKKYSIIIQKQSFKVSAGCLEKGKPLLLLTDSRFNTSEFGYRYATVWTGNARIPVAHSIVVYDPDKLFYDIEVVFEAP